MYWFIDHLAAFLIASLLLFVLAAIQMRSQNASIEASQFDSAKTSLYTATSVIEQDIHNMGAGYISPSGMEIEIDTTGSERSFSFWSRTDPEDFTPNRVMYRWEETGQNVTLENGETVPRFRLERRVDSGDWESLIGGTLTDVRITLRNSDLESIDDVVNLEYTRRIDVSLRMISPLGKGDLIEEVQWSRNIRPLNLQRHGGALLVE